jgi:NAD(P)-dependent dehydrogenase (short-subunit alcohol dehydrogenase family)
MLHNKVAIITGAASGIGRETAILLSNKDASLVLCDVNKQELLKTTETINKQGGRAISVMAE